MTKETEITCLLSGDDIENRKSRIENRRSQIRNQQSEISSQKSEIRIALLTGGGDKPYALGLAAALTSAGVFLDFIGSDDLSVPDLVNDPRVNFLNLRGDQRSEASVARKIERVATYYWRLIRYAATAKPKIFHILWNNKFELFDRTLLTLYYKLFGKRLVFTAHNVNAGKRDGTDSWLNRLTLLVQYRLLDHIFVHTQRMKRELCDEFSVPEAKVSVIPFGINNTVPNTNLSSAEAKARLGVASGDKTMLFFGNIAPYKGLEYLVVAFIELLKRDQSYRLLIVGKPKGPESYWLRIQQAIRVSGIADRAIEKIEYIPDDATELYFRAADILILPYAHVFQSGVLFLGYSFGLPAIAADVGSLREEIIEGQTGFVFRSHDPADLVDKVEYYFKSALFHELDKQRQEITRYASERYSWSKVAELTRTIYSKLQS